MLVWALECGSFVSAALLVAQTLCAFLQVYLCCVIPFHFTMASSSLTSTRVAAALVKYRLHDKEIHVDVDEVGADRLNKMGSTPKYPDLPQGAGTFVQVRWLRQQQASIRGLPFI